MPNRWLVWTLAALLVVGFGEPVWGQFSGSGSSRQGMFGSRTMGGNVTAGNRTFGGSNAFNNTGFSGSSFGGGTNMRSSGLGSGLGSTGTGTGGMLGANERFVRGNRQPGQFVGSDAQDIGSILQGLGGQGGMQGRGQASRSGLTTQSGNRTNQPNRGRSGGQRGRGSAQEIRVSISPAFKYSRPSASQLSTSLSVLVAKSPHIGKLSPIRIVLEGETVILRGAVETEHDRSLVEQLTLLEPGVRSVKNELIVGPLPRAPAVPSATPPE